MLASMNWLENDWTTYATFKVDWKIPIRSWESDANFSVVCCSVVEISACVLPVSNKSFIIFAYGSSAAMVLIHWSLVIQAFFHTELNMLHANQVQHTKKSITSVLHESDKLNSKMSCHVWPMARFLHFPIFGQSIKSKKLILDSQ